MDNENLRNELRGQSQAWSKHVMSGELHDNNTLHTEPPAPRFLEAMISPAAR
jgi:hypothetical protein